MNRTAPSPSSADEPALAEDTAPPESAGRLRGSAVFGFYLLASVILTWPVAISLGRATSIRGDYFNNLWNFWWVRRALTEWVWPWYTEHLYYPDGISLTRHTLSPINALAGALLSTVVDLGVAFDLLMLLKLTASGWAMWALARHLTGSSRGALIAGLLYAFNPFHFYYVAQVNVFTFEFMPLALLFFVRTYREGGRRNAVLAVVFSAAIAATTSYYVVYTFLIVGLLIVAGRLVDPEVRPWPAARRTTLVAIVAAGAVVVVALPLLLGTFQHVSADGEAVVFQLQKRRANDLLGFHWLGGPERATVSWPTMLGYSTLALLLWQARRLWRRQRFWLLVGAFFLVLSLGKTLIVAGKDTGVPLPYAALVELPVLSMLRKPDRCFVIVQLVVALLAAEAWRGLAARLPAGRPQRIALGGCAALMMLELTGVPFQRFDYGPPAYAEQLARDDTIESVIELPAMDIDVLNARYNLFQTAHEKKQPLGYCTALALQTRHNDQMVLLVNGYVGWFSGDNRVLPLWTRKHGVDVMIHHKSMPMERTPDPRINDRFLWAPFFAVRRALLDVRQTGQFVDQPLEPQHVDGFRQLCASEFGMPIHEDDEVMVFRVEEPR